MAALQESLDTITDGALRAAVDRVAAARADLSAFAIRLRRLVRPRAGCHLRWHGGLLRLGLDEADEVLSATTAVLLEELWEKSVGPQGSAGRPAAGRAARAVVPGLGGGSRPAVGRLRRPLDRLARGVSDLADGQAVWVAGVGPGGRRAR